jgi:hypothetical protein
MACPAALQYRNVRVEEMVADALREREAVLEAAFGQIVEEDTADAARLATMLEVEVLVAPALVP